MNGMEILQIIGVIGPILALLGLGFWLTLGSGVVGIRSARGVRQARANFSRLVLEVLGWVVGLAAVQQFIGPGLGFGW